jgi:hypothetical protein
MMLSVQNNFEYVIGVSGPVVESVAFASPNTAGDGLIVVAYFLSYLPGIAPNLIISDSSGNTYQSIGACGIYDGTSLTGLLQIWYVRSCHAGANTVTVSETTSTQNNTFILAVSAFEYSGGLGAVDGSNFATGLGRPNITLSLTTTAAGDLLFGFATQFGLPGTVALDSRSGGYTTEQTEAINQLVPPYDVIVPTLAVDRVAGAAGIETLIFDYTQSLEGLDTALLVALPSSLPAPPPPPPSPTAPVLSAGQAWPTIF